MLHAFWGCQGQGEATGPRRKTAQSGFVLEGAQEGHCATWKRDRIYWEVFRRLASMGLPAKTRLRHTAHIPERGDLLPVQPLRGIYS